MDKKRDDFEEQGYSLEIPLAADNRGELYRGTYLPHRRPVLFRRFASAFAERDAWQLAEAEIQAWARVNSPGIVQPLDWGLAPAGAFLATTRPRGKMLKQLIGEETGLDGIDADSTFDRLVLSVEAACQCGVLHLGLDLTNIWVAADEEVSVSEFGLWYVDAELGNTVSDDVLWLAPEQRLSNKGLAASDVYSLGLIYVAFRYGLARARDVAGGSPDVRELLREIPPEILKCLDAEPLSRHRSVSELAASLRLRGEPAALAWRDCPVCRLKREIEREALAREGSLPARIRRFFDEAPRADDPSRSSGAPAEPHAGIPPDGEMRGRMNNPMSMDDFIARIFPWVAIATLAVATLVVWCLAFR